MSLETAMVIAAVLFVLIEGALAVRWYLALSRSRVITRHGSPINVDQWSPEQKKKLAKLWQPASKGWDARKVNR